jgi:thiol-disulfide isomerase/thioredoxin
MKKNNKIILGIVAIIGLAVSWLLFASGSKSLVISDVDNNDTKIVLKGQPTCVFAWSITCQACIYSLPHIIQLKNAFEAQGGRFILVLCDDNIVYLQRARAMFIRYNLDLESYFDSYKSVAKKYSLQAFPTLLVFNKKGKLVNKFVGMVQWANEDMSPVLSVCEQK